MVAKSKNKPAEKEITFITGNKHKTDIAQRVLSAYGICVRNEDIDAPEIQSDSIEEIAKFSAEYAASKLGKEIITTDVGFDIPALNGFPGPYGKYVFKRLGVEWILALMKGKEDRRAFATEVLAFAAPNEETQTFKKVTSMTLLEEPRGSGSVMDQLMVIEGDKANYGSLSLEQQLDWWENTPNYFHDFSKWYTQRR